MTPKAYRLFQSKLLERCFGICARRGRGGIRPLSAKGCRDAGDETIRVWRLDANIDITGTFINALVRGGPGRRWFKGEDIQVHRTRNTPKCATVLMDMSGSMRYDGQYINVKRMGLGSRRLIRSVPGRLIRFIEMYSFAKMVEPGRLRT